MTKLLLSRIALIAVLPGSAFAGPLAIAFDSSLLPAGRGQTVTFGATVTNTGAGVVFLDADAVNIAAPLTVNDTKFFLNFPAGLAAGGSVHAPIFDVTVPAAAAYGLYAGRFDILQTGAGTVGSAAFAVNVVPEPGSLALFVVGGLALGIARRSKFVAQIAQSGRRFVAAKPAD